MIFYFICYSDTKIPTCRKTSIKLYMLCDYNKVHITDANNQGSNKVSILHEEAQDIIVVIHTQVIYGIR